MSSLSKYSDIDILKELCKRLGVDPDKLPANDQELQLEEIRTENFTLVGFYENFINLSITPKGKITKLSIENYP